VTDWRPTGTAHAFRQRAAMLTVARQFFADRAVLEVETPILTRYTTSEPGITSLREATTGAWMRTSPEHHMKRLLAAGLPDIFQIAKVFRAGERGRHHEPEFTMAEWYRLGFDLPAMIAETCEFIAALAASSGYEVGQTEVHDHASLCKTVTGHDLHTASDAELHGIAGNAPGFTIELGRQLRANRSACLDYIFSHVVQPAIPQTGLQVISHYPAEQAMLARLNATNPAVAERFEVFHQGIELANGFSELRDAGVQRTRFEADNQRRQNSGLDEIDADELLLDALTAGLPDCSGVAVGIDRVLMIACSADTLAATLSFRAGE